MSDLSRLSGFLTRQAVACGRLGSPMYEQLLHRAAGQLSSAGPLCRLLAPHAEANGPAATGLRLLGTVHRLVLERRGGDLALYYPSVGGTFDLEAAWPALLEVLEVHTDEVAAGMQRPPQTNEVGRAAALVGGLLRVLRPRPQPVRLHELGSSAGLNLLADQYRYVSPTGSWGPPDSPVRLDPAWTGMPTPLDRELTVVERHGCDPDPVDVTTTQGRTVLMSYVWPDQRARLERLRGAFAVAGRMPIELTTERAGNFVSRMRLADGQATVLWHSLMWQYLDPAEQTTVNDHVRRLSQQATPAAPLIHLFLEPWRRAAGAAHDFLVVAQTWPGGESQVLASAPGHGVPVTWEQ
ncbi:MAG: DUF2332 domain-containing protein [Nocardioidaceae bacterium]|nr:DUF2332 domain-containing protein [Nocardioidaceae bacterium]